MRDLRVRKDPTELERLAEASRRHDLVFDDLCADGTLVGSTENEITARIRSLMAHHDLADVAWIDVSAGPDTASALHAGGDRPVQSGDPVVIDFAGAWEGYFGDICRTPIAGEPALELTAIYAVVLEAIETAFDGIRPGMTAQAVDQLARGVIDAHDYGEFFVHRLGHGVGVSPHEHPYLVPGNADPLESGMTFSIEPGIYIPERFGIRIEDIVAVTASGARRLNNARRELTVL
jgi:Xaa-Pro aminopeptidase